jgi:cell division protease FtsH
LGPVGKWVALAIVALFVLNFWLASRSLSEPPRIGIPYSPLFLNEVRDGNVDRITSKGTSLQGQFRSPVRYPPTGSSSRSATRFSTLIPTFADTAALSKLLEDNNVVIPIYVLEEIDHFDLITALQTRFAQHLQVGKGTNRLGRLARDE